MTPNELRQQAAAKLAEAKELKDGAAKENRALTDEETKQFKALLAEHDSLQEKANELEEMEAGLADREKNLDKLSGNFQLNKTSKTLNGNGTQLEAPNFEKDPKRGYEKPNEFMLEVMGAGKGREPGERLKSLSVNLAAGSDEHGVYDDTHGGFFVPEAFSPEVLSTDFDDDPTAGRTRNVPMTAPSIKINARTDKNHTSSVSGGLTVTRSAETAAKSPSRSEFEKVTLETNDLFGFTYASNNLLNDSPISFMAILEAGFRDEFAANHLDEVINGNGVGKFLGYMNSPALVTVAKKSGQSADTIVYDNVVNMRARTWHYGGAIWLANHDTMPSLMQMEDTNGNLIWQPSAREGEPDRILGRPIFFNEFMETLGDKGDISCVNLSQYLEGEFQPLQTASSMHVRFDRNEMAFRFSKRNAGAPWWRSALTPKKSTKTLSPFVTLAARG